MGGTISNPVSEQEILSRSIRRISPEYQIAILLYLSSLFSYLCVYIPDVFFRNPKRYNEYIGLLWEVKKDNTILYSVKPVMEFVTVCAEKIPFTIVSLTLSTDKENFDHNNMLIFDNKNRTVERFEPLGKMSMNYQKKFKIRKLDNTLKNLFDKYNYLYISPSKFEYNPGLQVIGEQAVGPSQYEDPDGFCASWSGLYAYYRLLFNNMSREDIIKLIIKESETDMGLRDTVVRFAKFVSDFAKPIILHQISVSDFILNFIPESMNAQRIKSLKIPSSKYIRRDFDEKMIDPKEFGLSELPKPGTLHTLHAFSKSRALDHEDEEKYQEERCEVKTKAGHLCRRKPIPGTQRCFQHR